MKYILKLNIFILLATSLTLSSCKKDDEKDFLVDASCWKLVKSEYKDFATGQYVEEPVEACNADDCLSFKEDGKAVSDEGATKCDPSDPQSTEGTWTLSDDFKTLTLNIDGGTFAFTVEELTKDKLVVAGNLLIIEIRQTFEAK